MRKFLILFIVSLLTFAGVTASQGGEASPHVLTNPSDIQWGDPPAVFEKGARFAVMSGDPGAEGLYTVRLKLPAGYKIAPHWHPTDEHVTVLSGKLALGMGETFDTDAMSDIETGGYVLLPANMRHYAMAQTDAVIEVYGPGPFVLTYVNPADDPSKRLATE